MDVFGETAAHGGTVVEVRVERRLVIGRASYVAAGCSAA